MSKLSQAIAPILLLMLMSPFAFSSNAYANDLASAWPPPGLETFPPDLVLRPMPVATPSQPSQPLQVQKEKNKKAKKTDLKKLKVPVVGPPPPIAPVVPITPPPAAFPTRALSVVRGSSHQPFWRTKPEIKNKIMQDRAVVVAVNRRDLVGRPGWVGFEMKGAGLVNAPQKFSFQTASQFEKLKQVSDHFKVVVYDPERQRLFLILEALGYQARMVMEMIPVEEDWRSELQWKVIWGSFTGMKGVVGFEAMSATQTEISLLSDLETDHLPLPKILMGLTLEILTQKVAEKMRASIESEYKKAKGS